jgi:hypothetical protein
MRITEIEYGFTKNIGNYQNERVTYRAILEPWENPEESLQILRNKIAEELNLRFELKNLRSRRESKEADLKTIESQLEAKKTELEKAKIAWDNFTEFLTGHGVNPATLSVENFAETRAQHQYVPPKLTDIEQMRILYDIAIADDDENDEDDADPCFYDDDDDDNSDYCYGEM